MGRWLSRVVGGGLLAAALLLLLLDLWRWRSGETENLSVPWAKSGSAWIQAASIWFRRLSSVICWHFSDPLLLTLLTGPPRRFWRPDLLPLVGCAKLRSRGQ